MANKQPKKTTGNKGKKPAFNFYWIYAIIAVILISINLFNWDGGVREITPQKFRTEMLEKDQVAKLEIVNKEIVRIYIKQESLTNDTHKTLDEKSLFGSSNRGPHYFFTILNDEKLKDDITVWENQYGIEVKGTKEENYGRELFSWLVFIVIMIAVWVFIMKRVGGGAGGGGSQIFNIGKSKAQVFGKGKSTNVSFKDVAGLEEAKEEVQEIVEFLKKPKKYTDLGAKIPKGALLVGPPGTGKTLLAKAVAGEAEVPFFSLSGSDFVEMFVGVGASRVRDLFKQAKEKAPSIIFIDEIDAIGRARGKNPNMGSNDERENTLNQLLTEMDGFGTNNGVIILAATNRADVLDKALLRAGRFDRQIYVDMPDLNERRAIFDVHLKPLKKVTDLDIDFLAKQTPGFSGADIANICNEAALIAARFDKKQVEKQDFLDAVDRIIGGLEKKNKIISKEEKKAIAIHEAGHATVSWMVEHANPLVKVTIVPRGKSLGAAWYLPEERQITTTEQLLDEMCAALGGRAAELVTFGKISTGALSDLEKVTKTATAMVSIYGLNEKVGNVSYYNSQGDGYGFSKPYSDDTAKLIDDEVKNMIEEQYQRAIKLLEKNKDKLNLLADKLLEKEVIFKDDLEAVFGKRAWVEKEKTEEVKVKPEVKLPKSPEATPEEKSEDIKEAKPTSETIIDKIKPDGIDSEDKSEFKPEGETN
ncbi:MAG: ATP-dependent zinc metalloprotease FtsH [Flavobacteriales bacterium]|nr:ATP-dependent zinc metalloprotease FtsH [Flavobacteriales bacterium]